MLLQWVYTLKGGGARSVDCQAEGVISNTDLKSEVSEVAKGGEGFSSLNPKPKSLNPKQSTVSGADA